MRKIPTKNYLIYGVICIVTFLLLILFVYKVNTMGITKKTVLSGFLYEIPEEAAIINLKSYSMDNPNFFLYISNDSNSDFELLLKDYLIDSSLNDSVVYLNGWNKLDTQFINEFQKELFVDSLKGISSLALKQSNIYAFQEGKVVDVLYKEKEKIVIEDVKNFIESFGEVTQ